MSRNSDDYGSATSYPVHTFPALMVDVLVKLWGNLRFGVLGGQDVAA